MKGVPVCLVLAQPFPTFLSKHNWLDKCTRTAQTWDRSNFSIHFKEHRKAKCNRNKKSRELDYEQNEACAYNWGCQTSMKACDPEFLSRCTWWNCTVLVPLHRTGSFYCIALSANYGHDSYTAASEVGTRRSVLGSRQLPAQVTRLQAQRARIDLILVIMVEGFAWRWWQSHSLERQWPAWARWCPCYQKE